MNPRRSKHGATQALVAYLEEELAASDARAVEAQLEESLETRRRFDQLLTVRDVLTAPVGPLEQLDLSAAVQQALATAEPAPRRRHGLAVVLGSLVAVAACVGLLVLPVLREDAQYRAKSARIAAPATKNAPRFHVYTPTDSGIMPVAGSVASGAGLVFSYSNPSADSYPFLMVFGVDESREVRWFYPPYEIAGSDPTSISIAQHNDTSMLPDIVRHDLAPGRMVLYALFTRESLRVSQIEQWLRGHKGELSKPPRRDAVLLRLPVMVKR